MVQGVGDGEANLSKLRRFAVGVVGWNLLVILWGAFVRATGSGAGCGSHWPTCNGEVIPRAPGVATLIEFTHRATSGLALISVVLLVIWVWRVLPAGHWGRKGAAASLLLMLTEAGVGAGLVLFELVAHNKSVARALFMSVHLTNTFGLIAALTLTAAWIAGWERPRRLPLSLLGPALLGLLTLVVVGVSGAIAALGDTLFPANSLADALRADLDPTSHVLLRLRIWHPFLAVASTGIVLFSTARLARGRPVDRVRRLASLTGIAVFAQIGLGIANVALLAPAWMQLVHLAMADAVWLLLVCTCAAAAGADPAAAVDSEASTALAPDGAP